MATFTSSSDKLASYEDAIVGIYDPTSGIQLFREAHEMKANITRSSRIMDHPKENGDPVSDYKIILPNEIDLAILIDSSDLANTYRLMVDAFKSSQFLTIQTNADTFENMVISGMPHDEAPDMWGMLVMSCRLREVQLVTVQFQALTANDVAEPTDQSTVNSGEQTPVPEAPSALHALIFGKSKAGQ